MLATGFWAALASSPVSFSPASMIPSPALGSANAGNAMIAPRNASRIAPTTVRDTLLFL